MINVIRKEAIEPSTMTISSKNIKTVETADSFVMLDPVKDLIEITYDALGNPDKKSVSFGVQYDHRVSWIRFNLDDLVWNMGKGKAHTIDELYNLYTFKVMVTRVGDASPAQV